MDESTTNAIEVRNLVKGHKGARVLQDVSFTVGPGTVFALLGANGSGKTTRACPGSAARLRPDMAEPPPPGRRNRAQKRDSSAAAG